MIYHIEILVEKLRDELKQYGELLALLDQQQELVLKRDADGIQSTAEQIDQQSMILEELKTARKEAQSQVAEDLGLARVCAFENIIPLLPQEYQPLINAIIEDNNLSIQRIGRLARQNHLLLTRSIEMVGSLIRSVCPDQTPNVYNGNGAVISHPGHAAPTYEHVC